ncbi:hypothetical protein, partial [Actinomadura keratinilytica]|uniref:hypothetical protein n=1 Tax=Actinomadura keratinilytica TaxID=547461 RepID=UPI0031E955E3
MIPQHAIIHTGPLNRDDVGDQTLDAGLVLAHHHRNPPHRCVRGKGGLDLAQLDPEPPNLHLIV